MSKYDDYFLFIDSNCLVYYYFKHPTFILSDIKNIPLKLVKYNISNLENKLRKDKTWNLK